MAGNQKSSTARNFEMHPLVDSSTAAAKYSAPNAKGVIMGDINNSTIIGHISG